MTSDVWLRKDIRTTSVDIGEGLSQDMWEAFEVHVVVPGHPSPEEVAESFDELWWQAERGAMAYDDWRADVDAALLDIMEAVIDGI